MLAALTRTVKEVIQPIRTFEGAGFPVFRPRTVPDPFLMLDEFGPIEYGPGEAKGAPFHPHRGFITVSYLLSGEFVHQDSMGNKGLLRPGDVQFMTAGSGVIHDESPSKNMLKKGGLLHGFQIWVNLPSRLKMIDPDYQDVPAEHIPVITIDDNGSTAKVIAGDAFGVTGPVKTHTPIQYVDFVVKPNSTITHQVPSTLNVMLYLIEGQGLFGQTQLKASPHQAVIFSDDGDSISVTSTSAGDLRFLLLAGEPINEPIARAGPFVMNTREELYTAYREYDEGTFVKAKGKFLHRTTAADV